MWRVGGREGHDIVEFCKLSCLCTVQPYNAPGMFLVEPYEKRQRLRGGWTQRGRGGTQDRDTVRGIKDISATYVG